MSARFLLALLLAAARPAAAQIPVEVLAGHQRTTVDIMFFRFFQNREGQPSEWLFFSRSRAAVEYRQTAAASPPQFGFTGAVSWNRASLKGVAPVAVAQILSRGVFAKAGLQYAHLGRRWTVFGWAVSELNARPVVDVFALVRCTPAFTARLGGFFQLESLAAVPAQADGSLSLVQRGRAGLKTGHWQYGLGADFSQTETGSAWSFFSNAGLFIRHEF
ncbi:MAG: hypothetical protein NW241_21960 [Bacteroidia bacterium]|nr:hypothetical protein [Bacteroidia bacterium]